LLIFLLIIFLIIVFILIFLLFSPGEKITMIHSEDNPMLQSRQAAVCLLVQGDSYDQFCRSFTSVLSHAPLERIQLRLAFGAARDSFHYALGTLIPDNGWPTHCWLPGGVERFGLTTT